MRMHESPNVPFTVLYERFKEGMRYTLSCDELGFNPVKPGFQHHQSLFMTIAVTSTAIV